MTGVCVSAGGLPVAALSRPQHPLATHSGCGTSVGSGGRSGTEGTWAKSHTGPELCCRAWVCVLAELAGPGDIIRSRPVLTLCQLRPMLIHGFLRQLAPAPRAESFGPTAPHGRTPPDVPGTPASAASNCSHLSSCGVCTPSKGSPLKPTKQTCPHAHDLVPSGCHPSVAIWPGPAAPLAGRARSWQDGRAVGCGCLHEQGTMPCQY